jgi:hypothetical protein
MMACFSRLRNRASKLWRRTTEKLTSIRMGRRFCAIAWTRTSLNRGADWLYHRRMDIDGSGKKLNDFT